MSDVTIICCYNNEKVYNDFMNSLKTQTCPYELIGINNVGNKNFSSSASAYNSVINQVKTKYVIYSHQDILLYFTDTLEKFVNYLDKIKTHDILGVAGVKLEYGRLITRVTNLENLHKKRDAFGMVKCFALDECFFGGFTQYFKEQPFDEIICDNWHLYAVEQCLRIKSNYLLGGGVLTCDVEIVHKSSGNYSPQLYTGFYKLCRKYSQKFSFIRTCCVYSRTDFLHIFPYCLKYYVRAVLRKILKYMGIYERVKKLLS